MWSLYVRAGADLDLSFYAPRVEEHGDGARRRIIIYRWKWRQEWGTGAKLVKWMGAQVYKQLCALVIPCSHPALRVHYIQIWLSSTNSAPVVQDDFF